MIINRGLLLYWKEKKQELSLWGWQTLSSLLVLTSSQICNEGDIPTQFPTQGQWWSNLAMQRLHTAQCLDLMGFRICEARKQSNIVILLLTSSAWILYILLKLEFTKQVLQNMLRSRLPVSASSTIVWRRERKDFQKEKTMAWRKKMDEQLIYSSRENLFRTTTKQSQTVYKCTSWGGAFQLSDHTGGSAKALRTGTKAPVGFTV